MRHATWNAVSAILQGDLTVPRERFAVRNYGEATWTTEADIADQWDPLSGCYLAACDWQPKSFGLGMFSWSDAIGLIERGQSCDLPDCELCAVIVDLAMQLRPAKIESLQSVPTVK